MAAICFEKSLLKDIPATNDELAELGRHWVWIFVGGLLFVVLGFVAFALPVATTIGVTFGIAGIILASGVVQLVQAIKLRRRHGGVMRFFQAVLSLVVGGVVLRYPGAGMVGIALALSFYFFIRAALQWILFSAMQPFEGRGWILASSIISFWLGTIVILTLPLSALWVPGLLVGIDLVIAGGTMIGFAFLVRRLFQDVHGEDPLQTAVRPTMQPRQTI